MRSVLAIAVQSLRQTIRSKTVWVLLALLLLAVIGLPLTIQGDGTIAGQVRIVLSYTLGAARLLLSITLVWAGCAAVSTEMRDRQIQMIVTKPVGAFQVWLGKWLGLVLLSGFLLAGAGGAAYLLLRWTTRPERMEPEDRRQIEQELLVARRIVHPVREPLGDRVFEEYERRRLDGSLPEGLSRDEALASLREALRLRAAAVPTGSRKRWLFRVGRPPPPDTPLHLEFKLASSAERDYAVTGLWQAGPVPDDFPYRRVHQAAPGGVYTLSLPVQAVGPDGALTIEYGNIDPRGVTVLFLDDDDVRVLAVAGGFGPNYVRALLLLWIRMALLAAIGVTAGVCFSLPVAAFVAGWVLLLLQLGNLLERLAAMPDHGVSPGWTQHAGRLLFRGLHLIMRPLLAVDPLEALAGGRLLEWRFVGAHLLGEGILLCGLLAWFGHGVLNRREPGLPAA